MRFKTGDEVEVTQAIDLTPHAILRRGERGTVVAVEDVFGEDGVFVKLKTKHEGLPDNTALLVPPEVAYLAYPSSWALRALAWFTGGSLTTYGLIKVAAPLNAVLLGGLRLVFGGL